MRMRLSKTQKKYLKNISINDLAKKNYEKIKQTHLPMQFQSEHYENKINLELQRVKIYSDLMEQKIIKSIHNMNQQKLSLQNYLNQKVQYGNAVNMNLQNDLNNFISQTQSFNSISLNIQKKLQHYQQKINQLLQNKNQLNKQLVAKKKQQINLQFELNRKNLKLRQSQYIYIQENSLQPADVLKKQNIQKFSPKKHSKSIVFDHNRHIENNKYVLINKLQRMKKRFEENCKIVQTIQDRNKLMKKFVDMVIEKKLEMKQNHNAKKYNWTQIMKNKNYFYQFVFGHENFQILLAYLLDNLRIRQDIFSKFKQIKLLQKNDI